MALEYRVVLRHDANCYPCYKPEKISTTALYRCEGCHDNGFIHAEIHTVGASKLCSSCARGLGWSVLQARMVGQWTDTELPATTLQEHRVVLRHNLDCPGCRKTDEPWTTVLFTSCSRCLQPKVPAGIHFVGADPMCGPCADEFGIPQLQSRTVTKWANYDPGRSLDDQEG